MKQLTIFLCFVGSALAGAGLAASYWYNGDTAVEGACLGVALILAAAGLIIWSHHLLPQGPYSDDYPDFRSPPKEEAEVLESLQRGDLGRRKVLLGSLGVAGFTITAGALSTVRSFGPAPDTLATTIWKDKLRLVDSDGRPVGVDDLEVGGVASVFPEGHVEDPATSAMLIKLPPGANHPVPGRETWAPNDLICYSKVCSHAGCPVNLYNRQTLDMECPCHQSTFAVAYGAVPIYGPAAGSLAQLPLTVDPDGSLRSGGDYSQPPGPVFWHYDSRNA